MTHFSVDILRLEIASACLLGPEKGLLLNFFFSVEISRAFHARLGNRRRFSVLIDFYVFDQVTCRCPLVLEDN